MMLNQTCRFTVICIRENNCECLTKKPPKIQIHCLLNLCRSDKIGKLSLTAVFKTPGLLSISMSNRNTIIHILNIGFMYFHILLNTKIILV